MNSYPTETKQLLDACHCAKIHYTDSLEKDRKDAVNCTPDHMNGGKRLTNASANWCTMC